MAIRVQVEAGGSYWIHVIKSLLPLISKGCCPIKTHCAYNATVMFRQSRRLSPQEQPFSSWYWTSKTPGASLADDWSNSAVVCSSFCVALSMQSFWSSPFCSVFFVQFFMCYPFNAVLSMWSSPCSPFSKVLPHQEETERGRQAELHLWRRTSGG